MMEFCCCFLVLLQSDLANPLSVLDLTINLIFMFDIWMNFHTAILGKHSTGAKPHVQMGTYMHETVLA
jgi:hypothetical protein